MLIVMMFLLVSAGVSCAVEIQDIQPDHWAYDYIQKLVKKGYLALYSDGSFKGDQPVSRVVFAAALGKLIDQIESGELRLAATDLKEIKKLSDEFKAEIADYDTKVASLEKRLSDIESGKVVIQQDISKATLEFREGIDENTKQIGALQQDIEILTDQVGTLSENLKRSEQSRKRAQNSLWIGVAVAVIVGLASD
ncbi:MAG: S-layer homology domain-containing protein [bacterium]